jgi:uncharacterized protein
MDSWMETFGGHTVQLMTPSVDDIRIEDIAHHLALQCRFNGACRVFYSVAQHSINVAELLPKWCKLEGLLHDAAEAYIGDVTRPMKEVLDSSVLPMVEATFNQVIANKFLLKQDATTDLLVKDADWIMLKSEAQALMRTRGYAWNFPGTGITPVPIGRCWDWAEAKERFLLMFYSLRRGR